ncbi:K-box region/MADS-box transcription factor family protein [Arabidopsis thaliana]|uniref:K-box region/MADS-box transcription factor family protein n=3 Tax=Arabidopsis thaliana TaxID=3702 RepID=A0A2H1ZE96_ARATH|nr:K-box region/MADS-box transcription factor family protein [Arabidopsis thaliana]AED97999.2 K-box region/MADS-box transcription factor family protein [Arabidopsis thaliana]BAB11644.1 MADS box transcription factor-like protein [Arabidopsis thaliana]|eukprot:NP_001078799.2 K-box region/MADS-box transcription factor family protein [Arabidopsis thaliana]
MCRKSEAMGRRRVEIKRIENKSSRQVTFCKRRNGLMEKARQLSILCGSSVALFIVSSTGKLYNSSSGDRVVYVSWKRKNFTIFLSWQDLEDKTQDYLSHKELLEIVQRKIEEAKGDNVSIESLISMEEQLKSALSVIRARKTELLMELVKNLQDKEKLLKEKNKVLASEVGKLKKILETGDERAVMSPENSSGHSPPETLPLLK